MVIVTDLCQPMTSDLTLLSIAQFIKN